MIITTYLCKKKILDKTDLDILDEAVLGLILIWSSTYAYYLLFIPEQHQENKCPQHTW